MPDPAIVDTPAAVTTPAAGAVPASSTPASSTPPAPKFEYGEDRSKWIPPHRMAETSRKAQEAERRAATAERSAEERARQVEALTGVRREADADPEEEAVHQFLIRKYPALAKLDDKTLTKLLDAADKVPTLEQQASHYWETVGHDALRTVRAEAEKVFGGALTARQKRIVETSFIDFVESDPDMSARYDRRDPTVVADFFKEFSGAVVDPVKRRTETTVAARADRGRRLPRGGTVTPVVGAAAKKKPTNVKELAEQMFENYDANE